MKITPALNLDVDEPFSKALDEILSAKTIVIVTKQGKYYGTIEDRNIPKSISNPAKTKCGTVSVKAPALSISGSVYDHLNAFMAGHFKSLPVVDEKGKPLGIFSRIDLLEELLQNNLIPRQQVSSVANKPIFTIDSLKTVAEAKGLMKQLHTHHLLVMGKGRPYGIVSTFDLAAFALEPKGRMGKSVIPEILSLDQKRVDEVLRPELAIIQAEADLAQAAQKMMEEKHSSLLVSSGGRYVGVIAATDIFKLIIEESAKQEEMLIFISGLHEDEKSFIPQINEAIREVINKYQKSLTITNISLHFKKEKSTYIGKLSLDVNNHLLAISAEEYDFKTVLNALSGELYTLLHKQKDKLNSKKRKKQEWE